ncbi:mannitol dehydrogenase family protein [Gayadomonas joobiniege]|uniref:mannitol dehydrogenase family protein n=1 Tax=Gayadomonas joobiniege TaxID=1234606 RepID=UPI0003807752|nr:mannitol dehydrogenase family protein [Gayadomonas joobiniege]
MHNRSRLNKQKLADLKIGQTNFSAPKYDPEQLTIGIVHLGLGNFHRAHQAMYTEQLLNKGEDLNWGICGVSMRNQDLQQKMQQQDNLFTVAITDKQDKYQVVAAIKEVLVAAQQLPQVLRRLAARETKIVSLTVTEKGYCLNSAGELDLNLPQIQADIADPHTPATAVGILVAGLQLRFQAGIPAFNVIACDNLPANGDKLARAVIQLAEKSYPELAVWIKNNVQFPNTMVDCITPATEQAILGQVSEATGYKDLAAVPREGFSQWVIENTLTGERPQWENAGVIFTDDVESYEHAKLRILNGLHSTLAYLGTLLGYTSVFEAVSDKKLKHFLIKLLEEEIIPTINPPKGLNLAAYSRDIIARFENPKIRHLLSQIACDGSIKIPVRILAPALDNLKAERENNGLYWVIAAWMQFLHKAYLAGETINDPRADEIIACLQQFGDQALTNVNVFFAIPDLIPVEIKCSNEVKNQVAHRLANINDLTNHL